MSLSSVFRLVKLVSFRAFFPHKFKNPISIAFGDGYLAVCIVDSNSGLILRNLIVDFTKASSNILLDNISSEHLSKFLYSLGLYKKSHLLCNLAFSINDVIIKNIKIEQEPIASLYERVYQELSLSLMTDDLMFDYVITASDKHYFFLKSVITKRKTLAKYYHFAENLGFFISKISIDVYNLTKMLIIMYEKDNSQYFHSKNIIFIELGKSCVSSILIVEGLYKTCFDKEIVDDYKESLNLLFQNINSYLLIDFDQNSLSNYHIIIADKFSNEQMIVEYIECITKTRVITFGELYKRLYIENISIYDLNLLYKAIALSNYFGGV
jgi:hypothetical protein